MRNSYVIAILIIIVVVLAFVFGKNKTEAPKEVADKTVEVGATTLTDGSYKIDTEASVISWRGENITGKGEEGTVMFESGSATISQGLVSLASFVMDMNTIKSKGGIKILDDHLKSDDFFAVAKYSESSFALKTITPSSTEGAKVGRYIIGGNLTVKGIEKPISFPATITTLPDGSIKAESSFAINRVDWDIKYNSQTFFSNLGDAVIRDAVEIGLDIRAVKE
jgi:polyisoprenoid-binding protein YceI